VALAQELFFESANVADEGEASGGEPQSRSDRVSGPGEAQLARLVRELRALEDDIVTKLTTAERLLGQLASRRVHEDAGYLSRAEFEQRMLAPAKLLRAMREAVPSATGSTGKLSVAKREAVDPRARQNKALTAIARGLERIRKLDGEIHQCASAARAKLSTIEEMRVFEECGYTSFEEFLERALGPSPVLANIMTLLPTELAPERVAPSFGVQTTEDRAGSGGERAPSGRFKEAPALFEESPAFDEGAIFDEPPAGPAEVPGLFANSSALFAEPAGPPVDAATPDGSSSEPADQAAPSVPPPSPELARRRRTARIVVGALLCFAAAVAGAAAGVASDLAVAGRAAPVPALSTAGTPPSPGVEASPAPKQAPAATPPVPGRHSDGR
jgi:hypothetical protein